MDDMHRYEIFLKSGASRIISADEIIYEEEFDDNAMKSIKKICFLRNDCIVAQIDRDMNFIIVEEDTTEKQ